MSDLLINLYRTFWYFSDIILIKYNKLDIAYKFDMYIQSNKYFRGDDEIRMDSPSILEMKISFLSRGRA